MKAMQQELLFKVLVIGDLGVGKTSIIKRYVHQIFSQHYRATIGVDFALKVLQWNSDTVIRLQLWDIAGQERYGNMTRVYYREAVGALVVFDVTRASTFDAVLKWKDDLDSKVTLNHGRPVPAVLLANKSDQLGSQQPKLDSFCRENGFAGWFETSAKVRVRRGRTCDFVRNSGLGCGCGLISILECVIYNVCLGCFYEARSILLTCGFIRNVNLESPPKGFCLYRPAKSDEI
uniref:Ras-related protein Rab n=1 Tax=Echeneis naucrates TaxID=173247 RepID=A0A665U9N8_ECHNA